LIRLSGFVPEEEIPITFVGLRPGEKLCEELVGADETIAPSGVAQIFQVQAEWLPDPEVLAQQLTALEELALQGEPRALLELLYEVIPTFRLQHAAPHGGEGQERAAGII
jgi:FlaA1/EpsC-like NDP-sugar epimerase